PVPVAGGSSSSGVGPAPAATSLTWVIIAVTLTRSSKQPAARACSAGSPVEGWPNPAIAAALTGWPALAPALFPPLLAAGGTEAPALFAPASSGGSTGSNDTASR